jgi:hypothetical protein
MKLKHIVATFILLCISGWGPFYSSLIEEPIGSAGWINQQIKIINAQATNLDPQVLKLGLQAYLKLRQQGLDDQQLMTIIDYSKPSTERRLWVVDLKHEKVLFNTWVTHGRNSGSMNPDSFSNQPGSLKSSLGVFLTDIDGYEGGNGYSLRLVGLEHGINDNAYRRDIVVHGAWYAHPNVIKKYGVLGRSWGCPAVSVETAKPLIDTIKKKTLVFVYYPDQNWLKRSNFLAT